MKVRKVGILDEKNQLQGGPCAGDFLAILTNCDVPENEKVNFSVEIILGEGPSARRVNLDVPIARRVLENQLQVPVNVEPNGDLRQEDGRYIAAFMFKNQFFLASDDFPTKTFREEAVLLVKKYVFESDKRLKKLKREVEAIERVLSNGGPKRTLIPEVVKLVVWERDEGKCVRCGSTENLHFDHIIPVTKGGGTSEENIQLLCADCNLEKSDKIAF